METFLMKNSLNVTNGPYSTAPSCMAPTTTFFDSFVPPNDWLWTLDPMAPVSAWQEPLAHQPLVLSQAQLDALKYELASPAPSPRDFFFEIEPDMTNYEPCYDEFLETKFAVMKELLATVEEKSAEEHLQASALGISSPVPTLEELPPTPFTVESLSVHSSGNLTSINDELTLPNTSMDDFWFDMDSVSANDTSSPSSSSTSSLTSASTSSSPSVATPPSSISISRFPSLTQQPIISVLGQWEDELELELVDDNLEDEDYEPYEPLNKRLFRKSPAKSKDQHKTQLWTNVDHPANSFSVAPPIMKSAKRKLESLQEQCRETKRQKVDPNVVCRIRGCKHISKTRFECFKHRETHFPGRFQCPNPGCDKVFVRSSSLSRHLKRPRNADCNAWAGSQANWGTGLSNFALHGPEWELPGFHLDDLVEV